MSINLITLLYYQQKQLPSDDDQFYHQFLEEIENERISPQVYFLLKEQGRLDKTPDFFHDRLKENYKKIFFNNLFIKSQLELILKEFEKTGIDMIPLKGVYFAEKYFGNIGARRTSDIDLLIRFEDLDKVIDSVKALGFSIEGEKLEDHFHCSFCKSVPWSPHLLIVEIHWNLLKEKTSNFSIDDLWKEAIPLGDYLHIKELSPNHTFYMICLHGWRHNLESLKYFLDIIQIIYKQRDDLDYGKILTLAKRHQTFKRMMRTLSIVYQQFPELNYVKEFPFKKRKTFWEYKSVKGFKQYIDFMDYQFFSYDSLIHSLMEIHRWFWPSKHDIYAELGTEQLSHSFFKMYGLLYKKRFSGIIKFK